MSCITIQLKENNIYISDPKDIDNRINETDKNRKDAFNVLHQLVQIKTQLADENIKISGRSIIIPSIQQKHAELDQSVIDLEGEIHNLALGIRKNEEKTR